MLAAIVALFIMLLVAVVSIAVDIAAMRHMLEIVNHWLLMECRSHDPDDAG